MPWALLLGALAVVFLHGTVGLGHPAHDRLIDEGLGSAVTLLGVLMCLARVVIRREDRLPWMLVSCGLACWWAADLYYSLVLSKLDAPPYPSISDIGWIVYYPALYVTVSVMLRRRVAHFYHSLWLDGLVVALAVAAVVAAVVLEPIIAMSIDGRAAAVAVNLAYPIGDLLLIAMLIGAFAATGWRPDRTWLLLGVGVGLSAVADISYLHQIAVGTYEPGTWFDAFWPASVIATVAAAWQAPIRGRADVRPQGLRLVAVPSAAVLAALTVLTWDHFDRLPDTAIVLSTLTLVTALVRIWLTFLEHARLSERRARDALTDVLTGLGNRRRLVRDLEIRGSNATPERPVLLLLLDLNGFKSYNDTFGHQAGDTLLARLGRNLEQAVAAHGDAYRMGGDEFCVLAEVPVDRHAGLTAVTREALREPGEGFEISAACGAAVLSTPDGDTSDALRLADQAMYADKAAGRASAGDQSAAVLLRVLAERDADLGDHVDDVARLCAEVTEILGLAPEQRVRIAQAAALHDVGKAAIPDAILDKPGPLDDAEWAFMRRHTLIGERIMVAAPALVDAAALVRASHERFDGGGYPDGLAGEDIPLGARIIAVCDAYDAVVTDRPYCCAMPHEAAIAELQACAGSQFDPVVVDALVAATCASPRPSPEHGSGELSLALSLDE